MEYHKDFPHDPGSDQTANPLQLLPLEVIDMCLGSIIHIAMKSDKETVETLVKFDDFLDVVLGDITEFGIPLEGKRITR